MVVSGANLGWDFWEGSFRKHKHAVSLRNPRADAAVTYPVVEFDRQDPLFSVEALAVTGPVVYRHHTIPNLTDRVLFGDLVSGEVFYFDADDLPDGGQDAIHRVLFHHAGKVKSFRQMVKEKVVGQDQEGRWRLEHTDLRFGTGPVGQLFLLNKVDR